MKRTIRHSIPLALLGLLLALPAAAAPKPSVKAAPKPPATAPAKPPVKVRTVEQALKLLPTAQGDDLAAVAAYLDGRPDLLPRQAKALAAIVAKAPADAEVALRVLDRVRGREAAGCTFAAEQLDAGRPGWQEALLLRSPDLPRCPAMSAALGRLMRRLPDPAKSPDSEKVARRVLAIAQQRKDAVAANTSCRFLLGGPNGLRAETLKTLMIARPETSGECLVQAYAEEAARAEGDPYLRADLLKGLVTLSGVDSVPTLRLALENKDDRDLACALLRDRGPAAIDGLVFAVRTGDARSEGVKACLFAMGVPAIRGVLPLLDHPSPRIRGFAIEFLGRFRSPEARDVLQKHFLGPPGLVDRQVLLGLLDAYPADEVEEPLREALSCDDPRMRHAGLDAVESTRAAGLLKALQELAEEDPDPAIRRRALEVAWHLNDATVLPLARRMATYEEDVPVAAMAIRLLGFLGGKEEAAIVGRLIGHKDPGVAAAAVEAGWLLGLEAPRKDKVEYVGPAKAKEPKGVRELACPGVRAKVRGKKGPAVIVLPGGPGMDLSWAWLPLQDLADDAVVAFVEPQPADEGPASAGLVAAESLKCVREALGADRVVLVSHGLGGTWALSLAAAMPDVVTGVVALMAPLPGRLGDVDAARDASLNEPLAALAGTIAAAQRSEEHTSELQ